ncbi:MAG: hypothetical protein R6U84_07215, partial [Candidatus Cloacimonadales bacterium]
TTFSEAFPNLLLVSMFSNSSCASFRCVKIKTPFPQTKAAEVYKSRNMALNPIQIDLPGVVDLYKDIKRNISLD